MQGGVLEDRVPRSRYARAATGFSARPKQDVKRTREAKCDIAKTTDTFNNRESRHAGVLLRRLLVLLTSNE